MVISAKVEEEIAQLPGEERKDFLDSIGLSEPGLNRMIRTGYDLLGLLTFFTAGPKEAHAWTGDLGKARTPGGRRHPYRFRTGLHPVRDYRLGRLYIGQR